MIFNILTICINTEKIQLKKGQKYTCYKKLFLIKEKKNPRKYCDLFLFTQNQSIFN